jgi:membrane-associated protease RseP (regulator of RpoE activity)
MGDSSSSFPETRVPAEPPPVGSVSVPPPPPRRPEPKIRFVVLLLLTYGSTYLAVGPSYAISLLAILGAHEFGHYFACRYYRVDASLPYFLPMPLVLTGTLGAFIRIRQPILRKRDLFDIGIAGPIAGFLVAIPVLFIGVYLSTVMPVAQIGVGSSLELGEPLLFQMASWMTFGPLAADEILVAHPMAFAGWFGLLATALNLFPFGQLDGGHISYAVLGQKSTLVSKGTVVILIGLSFLSLSWIAWTVLLAIMLLTLGARHPRVFDEDVPLDRGRMWLAGFAVVMFILCFTPAPIQPLDIVATP